MSLQGLQATLQHHAEEEPPDVGVGDLPDILDPLPRALLADDEVIEECLLEHVQPGAVAEQPPGPGRPHLRKNQGSRIVTS